MLRRFLIVLTVWFALAGVTGDSLQQKCDFIVGLGGGGVAMLASALARARAVPLAA